MIHSRRVLSREIPLISEPNPARPWLILVAVTQTVLVAKVEHTILAKKANNSLHHLLPDRNWNTGVILGNEPCITICHP